jgi:hypothetical protein
MISSRDLWCELFCRMTIRSLIPICNMVRNLQLFLRENLQYLIVVYLFSVMEHLQSTFLGFGKYKYLSCY